jgi:hypothetical protein
MSIAGTILVSLVMAQDPDQANVDEWILRLGADEIEIRERAQSELLKIGAPAATSLKRASKDPDFERASRARTILARIERKNNASAEKPPRPLDDASDDEESWFRNPSSGRVYRIRIRHLNFFDSWFWPFWGLARSHDI